jgi:hypothetical protein
MQPVPPAAPRMDVEVVVGSADARASRLDDDEADLRLAGGARLRMRRGDGRVHFTFAAAQTDAEILHPFLAPAAALAHMWSGRETLHAGAFATSSGGVAIFADKQGGKSTTLAWLASGHDLPVLADDLVVVADGAVLPGPRCIDLRPTSILRELLPPAGRPVRGSGRRRVTLKRVPLKTRLEATVMLRWDAQVAIRSVPPLERLQLLLPHRMYADRIRGDQPAILALAALPMVILTRPPGEGGLRRGAQALVDYFS